MLVGDDPASEIYVRNKVDAGRRVRPARRPRAPARAASLEDLLALVQRLNRSDAHDGILVQAPLPAAMGKGAAQRVFDAIDPDKDVDGFHPDQRRPAGPGPAASSCRARRPASSRCSITAASRSPASRAVVIGRSEIVGKPMALLLLQRDATVTICHSKTPDLPRSAAAADILVAAIGRAGFVTPRFRQARRTVIDVGINRVTDAALARSLFGADSPRLADFEQRGSVVVGDVHPARCRRRRCADAGARRRRAADHRDAAQEHRGGARRLDAQGLSHGARSADRRHRDRQIVLPGALCRARRRDD